MLRSNIRIFAYLGRHKKPIYINELKTYYAMPFAHRVKPWRFNDKVLSFEDGARTGRFERLAAELPRLCRAIVSLSFSG